MRHNGADIRILDLKREFVVNRIYEFIETENLINLKKTTRDESTNIIAYSHIEKIADYWRKGKPQVVEWEVFGLDGDKTRVEIRIGLHDNFRFWFWCIFIGLLSLFLLSIKLGLLIESGSSQIMNSYFGNFQPEVSPYIYLFSIIILLFNFLLVGKTVHSSTGYSLFIDRFMEFLKEDMKAFRRQIIRSACEYPDNFGIVVASVITIVFFIFIWSSNHDLFIGSGGIFRLLFLVLLFIAVLLAFVMSKNHGFTERLKFVSVGLITTLSFAVIYNIPYINSLSADTNVTYQMVIKFNEYVKENSFKEMNREDINRLNRLARIIILGKFIGNIIAFSIALLLLIQSPKLAINILREKREYFVRATDVSNYKAALDFRGFSKSFYFFTVSFWLFLSLAIYWGVYVTLSVFEYNLLQTNYVFLYQAGKRFCEDQYATFFYLLHPQISKATVMMISRLSIFIYISPLLYIFYRICKKRVNGYLNDMRELKTHARVGDDNINKILSICRRISDKLEMGTPPVVIISSKAFFVVTKTVGISHIKSYILISEQCTRLKNAELEGILAHELYHIKYHSTIWHVLNLLSDFTLFGNGFLVVLINSYQNELKSDAFAVEYLKENNMGVSNYIDALRIMTISKSLYEVKDIGLKIVDKTKNIKKEIDARKRSLLNRIKNRIEILIGFYFGNEIISYIHPTLEERIEIIKTLSG